MAVGRQCVSLKAQQASIVDRPTVKICFSLYNYVYMYICILCAFVMHLSMCATACLLK